MAQTLFTLAGVAITLALACAGMLGAVAAGAVLMAIVTAFVVNAGL